MKMHRGASVCLVGVYFMHPSRRVACHFMQALLEPHYTALQLEAGAFSSHVPWQSSLICFVFFFCFPSLFGFFLLGFLSSMRTMSSVKKVLHNRIVLHHCRWLSEHKTSRLVNLVVLKTIGFAKSVFFCPSQSS